MTPIEHEDQFRPEPDLEAECRKARAKALDVCVWTRYRSGDFHSACGRDYAIGYDSMMPKEDGFDFCPFCGNKIEVKK